MDTLSDEDLADLIYSGAIFNIITRQDNPRLFYMMFILFNFPGIIDNE